MSKRILVVDDDRVNTKLVISLLEEKGFDVCASYDGDEGLDICAPFIPAHVENGYSASIKLPLHPDCVSCATRSNAHTTVIVVRAIRIRIA